jgi:hypothetical protein
MHYLWPGLLPFAGETGQKNIRVPPLVFLKKFLFHFEIEYIFFIHFEVYLVFDFAVFSIQL